MFGRHDLIKISFVAGTFSLFALCTGGFLTVEARAQEISRGPYVQRTTPTSTIIRWRTTEPTETRLDYGLSPELCHHVLRSSHLTTEHSVELTGLSPQTRYYYAIRTQAKLLAGGDNDHYVVTSPRGGDEPTRIWILGDAGSSGKRDRGEDPTQGGVRDGFLRRYPAEGLHFIMMLGDNAYDVGSDEQYQRGFFEPYRTVLRSKVAWAPQGNHDNTSQAYYQVYSPPTKGESGGVASGSDRFYAFDHGNVHVISLNSEIRDEPFRASMIEWLRRDLRANDKTWTIVFWHHPPYSKGHHDSDNLKDSGGRMAWMRENILPILEDEGVDLVFTGHSHSYERSKFISRHYGAANTFSNQFLAQPGDGRDEAGRAYTKRSLSKVPHGGTVYVVAGSAGYVQSGPLDHPAIALSKATPGSVLLEVDANEARAIMVGSDGTTEDSFTIRKAPERPRTVKNLVATVDGKSCRVVVTWDGASSDLSHSIYRSTTVDARGVAIGRVKGGGAKFVDRDARSSTGSLWYSVRAMNAHGHGPWGGAAVVANLPKGCSGPKS